MKEVSVIDIENLKIIRENVRSLVKDAAAYDSKELIVLDIAPQNHLGAKEFFKLAKICTLDIDINSKSTYIADICNDNGSIIKSNYFDIVICTEVLEHTLNPFDATKEILRILKPNGKCYVTTPFNFRIHGPSPDCWRFTEQGLRQLFKAYSSIEITSFDDEKRFLMPIQYQLIATK